MASFLKNSAFTNTYERKIKYYREEYYRYLALHPNHFISIDFTLITSIISIFIFLVGNSTIQSLVTSVMSIVILSSVGYIVVKIFNLTAPTNYIREVHRLGFPTISTYEFFLKNFLTGSKGYYEKSLNKIKKEYNITDSVPKIQGINGELYSIWLSSNQDEINLLNENTLYKPEIITIRMNNIRYFRIDHQNKNILLKTDIEYYRFDISALDILNEIMKNKRFDNIKNFNPEEYISDFEIYIHQFIERQKHAPTSNNCSSYDIEFNKIIFSIILLAVASGLYYTLSLAFVKLLIIILIIILNYTFTSLINSKSSRLNIQSDYSILKTLNDDSSCIERFNELKVALGINDSFDKIYSLDNACYYTWVANGYFHIFLNVIYTNVIYMSVKVSDVKYYHQTPTECIIKLKDKTLEFRRDAKKTFDKILPNRDYKWLKGYEQNL